MRILREALDARKIIAYNTFGVVVVVVPMRKTPIYLRMQFHCQLREKHRDGNKMCYHHGEIEFVRERFNFFFHSRKKGIMHSSQKPTY